MTRKAAFITFLFLSSTLYSCANQVYFISDPYWETVTNVSQLQVRYLGLKHKVLVHIITPAEKTPWIHKKEQENPDSNSVTSLKSRIEELLNNGHKVILSPFWLRNLEEQMPQFNKGQLVLIGAVSHNSKIQSVISDLEAGFHKMGQVAGIFMQKHPERERTVAMFYRGASYDKFYESFIEGFKAENPDPHSLASQRYYSAEINELNTALEELDPNNELVILGLAQLSNLVYRKLSPEKRALFMVEDFGDSKDSNQQIVLSLDTDYRQLMDGALALPPLTEQELSQPSPEGEKKYIRKMPYAFHLPNPELLNDVEEMQELVAQTIAQRQRQYNRLDRRISRTWNRLLNFVADFHTSDIPWPQWLRQWF